MQRAVKGEFIAISSTFPRADEVPRAGIGDGEKPALDETSATW